jgi:hypothetical protein
MHERHGTIGAGAARVHRIWGGGAEPGGGHFPFASSGDLRNFGQPWKPAGAVMPAEMKTTEAVQGPRVRHFSVFLPNHVGALMDLTKALGEANVHICGLDVVSTADSAILRMVVDDPARCREVLARQGVGVTETEAIAVELPQGPEKLAGVLGVLLAAEVNVEFAYSLMIRPRGKAVMLLHVDDEEFAGNVLAKAGIAVLGQADISR